MQVKFEFPPLPAEWRWSVKGPTKRMLRDYRTSYDGREEEYDVFDLYAVTGVRPKDMTIARQVNIHRHDDGPEILRKFRAAADELIEDIDRHLSYRNREQALQDIFDCVAQSQLGADTARGYDYQTGRYVDEDEIQST